MLKVIPMIHPEVLNLPVPLSSLQACDRPTSLHNDSKGSKVYGPLQENHTPSVPGRLSYQGSVPKRDTTEYKDHREPNTVLIVTVLDN